MGLGCTGETLDSDTDPQPEASLVVDAPWLQTHLTDDAVQVVDVRSPEDFAGGHVEGALSIPWDDLRAEVDGISGQVAPPDTVEGILSAAGLRSDARVVAYGARSGRDAGRLAWTLHYYDHADALILDGGWQGWQRADGAAATGAADPTASSWSAGPVNEAVRVSKDQVLKALNDDGVLILDVRSQEEFDAGHIPSAVHVEWTQNVYIDGSKEGLLRSKAEILALYPDADLSAPVYVYCRSGARAGLPYVALQWAGFQDVRLYDGSWNEWSVDGPVEQ